MEDHRIRNNLVINLDIRKMTLLAQFGWFRTFLVNMLMTFWVAFCNCKGCLEQLSNYHFFKKDIVAWDTELFSSLFTPQTLTGSCGWGEQCD